jgi:flagellar M-ring protein FliF
LPPGLPGADLLPAAMPAATPIAAEGADPAMSSEPSQTSKMIDIAQIQGQVHAQSVQKVGELADKNPRETVSIIRQWLDDSRAA